MKLKDIGAVSAVLFLLMLAASVVDRVAAQEPSPAAAGAPAKPDSKAQQAQIDNLQGVVGQLTAELNALKPRVPVDSEKQVTRRARASWVKVCTARGFKFDALHVDVDGKTTVVCR